MPQVKDNGSWSWTVFWNGFWAGFGKMMAAFLAFLLLVIPFADQSFASFGSAFWGMYFIAFLSAVYGYSAGEDAVRKWRMDKSETLNSSE